MACSMPSSQTARVVWPMSAAPREPLVVDSKPASSWLGAADRSARDRGFLMGFFSSRPNIEKLRQRGNAKGLIKALRNADVRFEATLALGSLGERALGPLIAAMAVGYSYPFEECLVRATALIGKPAVKPLLSLFGSDATEPRYRAMKTLGLLKARAAIDPLLTALGTQKGLSKARALKAIGEIAGREHLEIVLEHLWDDNDFVQCQAAEILGDLGDNRVVPALRDLYEAVNEFDPPNPEASRGKNLSAMYHRHELLFTLAGSLAKLGDPGALQDLYYWVKPREDDNIGERRSAVDQLGRVGGEGVLKALETALSDPDSGVRESAVWALYAIRDPGAVRILEAALSCAPEPEKENIHVALLWCSDEWHAIPVVSPPEVPSCVTFFVFDSDSISDTSGSAYDEFAETRVLRALASAAGNGGWASTNWDLRGCHGDLLATSMLGEKPATRVLQEWSTTSEHGIDMSRMDSATASKLRSGEDLGFIPYVVGLAELEVRVAQTVDEFLRSSAEGYKGLFTLESGYPIERLDSELALPVHLRLSGNRCRGWQVPKRVLEESGLEYEA